MGDIILDLKKSILLFFTVLFLVGCNNQDTQNENNQDSYENGQIEVTHIQPSDPNLFIQGLELSPEDHLLVSTGLYGESELGFLNLEEGEFREIDSLPDEYFGEGITQTEDYLWQVTWQENTAIKRNVDTYEVIEEVAYEGEGWGLAYNKDNAIIYMSDGTDEIEIRDSETFDLLDAFSVTAKGEPVTELNELEYADGSLYSNVWYEDIILEIDVSTGNVRTVYDVGPIIEELDLTENQREQMDSLNGIAHIGGNDFYLTGKLYPFVLEVELQ